MSLQELINNKKIIPFSKKMPFEQAKDEFNRGANYFRDAKKVAQDKTFNEEFVYKNIFDGIRKMCDAVVKLEGYRAYGKEHHKYTIIATEFIINDSNINMEFKRLGRMSTNRNKIEYSALTISSGDIEQSIKDGEKIQRTLEEYFDEKSKQEKLL